MDTNYVYIDVGSKPYPKKMENLSTNSSRDQNELSKKKSWDYFSIVIVIAAIICLFYLTDLKEGFDSALLISTIALVFPLSFRIPAIILRGLKYGMEKEKVELILLSLLVAMGLVIIGSYSKDWRFVFVFPFVSLLWTIVTLIARFVKGKLGL